MSKLYNDKVVLKLQNYLNSNDSLNEFIFDKNINIYVDIINIKFIDNHIFKVIPEDITKSYTSVWNNSVIKKFISDIKNNFLEHKYFYVFDGDSYYLLRKVDKSEIKEITKLNALDIKYVDNYFSIITISKSDKFNLGSCIVKATEVKNIEPEEDNTDELYSTNSKDDELISNSLFDDFE